MARFTEFDEPDLEIFQLTAEEVATSGQYQDELFTLSQEHQFRLCHVRTRLLDALIEQEGIKGGWFYCFPGCLPDSEAIGPYASAAEARKAAQEGLTDG